MQPRIKINRLLDSRKEALLWNRLVVYVQSIGQSWNLHMRGRTKDHQAQEHKMENRMRGKKQKNQPTFAQTGLHNKLSWCELPSKLLQHQWSSANLDQMRSKLSLAKWQKKKKKRLSSYLFQFLCMCTQKYIIGFTVVIPSFPQHKKKNQKYCVSTDLLINIYWLHISLSNPTASCNNISDQIKFTLFQIS